MPNNETAKTKSAPKIKLLLVVVVVVVLGVLLLAIHAARPRHYDELHVVGAGSMYKLEEATSDGAQKKGLGGRASMLANQGMVFIFDHASQQCFWMKDMRFSLDMIWLNNNRRVVHLAQNVSPRSYPKTFCAEAPAKYVIELNAGQVKKANIIIGQTLKF